MLQIFDRRGRSALLGLCVLLLGACTTTSIRPMTQIKPTQTYTTVSLGNIAVYDSIWATQVEHFRRGFVARLNETKAFANVINPAGAAPPADGITLSGKITEIDKGDKVARVLIGMGAGRERVNGLFEIADASGAVLARFENAKAYSGGAGIGGFDMLDLDELMEKFGADTADAVVRWSKGQTLDDTSQRQQ